MAHPSQARSPLSRPVPVATIPDEGLEIMVQSTAAERAALARLDGLVDLPALEARFTLRRERAGQGIAVRGEVTATVVQTCIVTLDPFPSEIREAVDLLFVSESRAAEWAAQHAHSDTDGDDDPPDAIVDGRIDLGAVTAEFLALGLDPYPRKPGVAFDEAAFTPEQDASPLAAALAKLKKDP